MSVIQMQFGDRMVTYDQFVSDVAARITSHLRVGAADPDYMTQNKAYKVFGRANVDRWRRKGLVEPCKRPGKVEYKTSRLRELQRVQQDYFQ